MSKRLTKEQRDDEALKAADVAPVRLTTDFRESLRALCDDDEPTVRVSLTKEDVRSLLDDADALDEALLLLSMSNLVSVELPTRRVDVREFLAAQARRRP